MLAVSRAVREERLARVAPALGCRRRRRGSSTAVRRCRGTVGTALRLADRGLTPAVAALVARDALDDVVTVNAPVVPPLPEVEAIVLGLA